MELSSNARQVLEARYLRRDRAGRIVETPDELFARVARGVAHAELLLVNARRAAEWEDRFLRLLAGGDFLPNSPTLMNAGLPLGQLSACFVLPVGDSLEAIFDALKDMALIQRTGGGTGFSFTHLRPKGNIVASTGGTASGPVSFMRIFDCATEHIKQGGRRRGANLGSMRVDHPDILEFVNAKVDGGIANFNISVAATDAFMDAVRRDDAYELLHPTTGRRVGSLRAREVFRQIAEAAWRTGDPGLLFIDAINQANPTPHLGQIETTNPCGEVPLLPHESCNLGSINLAHMLAGDKDRAAIDWERLGATVDVAVSFLDDVIEVNRYPTPEAERMARGNRKIGLGVMGFAELLVRLDVAYDSDGAVDLADRLMRFIAERAVRASQRLAEERGVYPFWEGSAHQARGVRVRNATCTAVAPTGTISIIANTSASIEPLFALAYRRVNVLDGRTLPEVNRLFLEYLERFGLGPDQVVRSVLEQGSLRKAADVPAGIKRRFVTALEVPAERHLQVQAAFQRHVDNSVSKTVNLPEEATPEDIARVYTRAWEMGLKGVTVYRYGSKGAQVLELGAGDEAFHFEHSPTCDPAECRL